jgi:hypothetical protein
MKTKSASALNQDRLRSIAEYAAELRKLGWQIQGLAYLIRMQRFDETPPMNIEELSYGIGVTLEELGLEPNEIAEYLV